MHVSVTLADFTSNSHSCSSCGVEFYSPVISDRRQSGENITCPNGHTSTLDKSWVPAHEVVSARERVRQLEVDLSKATKQLAVIADADRYETTTEAKRIATEYRAAKALILVLQQKLASRPRGRIAPPARLALPAATETGSGSQRKGRRGGR